MTSTSRSSRVAGAADRAATVARVVNPDGRRTTRTDTVAEARRRWQDRGFTEGEAMSLATALLRSSELVLSAMQNTLKPLGLTWSRWQVLGLLTFSRAGHMSPGRLGDRLRVHPASMTNTIDRLEEDGLLRRRPDPNDRRGVLCELTPDGKAVWEEATAALSDIAFGMVVLDEEHMGNLWPILEAVRFGYGDFTERE